MSENENKNSCPQRTKNDNGKCLVWLWSMDHSSSLHQYQAGIKILLRRGRITYWNANCTNCQIKTGWFQELKDDSNVNISWIIWDSALCLLICPQTSSWWRTPIRYNLVVDVCLRKFLVFSDHKDLTSHFVCCFLWMMLTPVIEMLLGSGEKLGSISSSTPTWKNEITSSTFQLGIFKEQKT